MQLRGKCHLTYCLVLAIIESSICKRRAGSNNQRSNNCKALREASACVKIYSHLYVYLTTALSFTASHLYLLSGEVCSPAAGGNSICHQTQGPGDLIS